MADDKLCRICLSREKNLVSVFDYYDNELIYKMIKFSIDISITKSDAFPKHICGVCLEEIKIAASVKRKGLNTNKILKDLIVLDINGDIIDESNIVVDDGEEMEHEEMDCDDNIIVHDEDNIIEECYTQPAQQKAPSKYLVYEEIPEHTNQPKFYYLPTSSSIKIPNTSYFEYNQNLKQFLEDYLKNKPNLEIIKIVNEDCIKEIEKILLTNDDETQDVEEYSEDYLEEIEENPSVSTKQPQQQQQPVMETKVVYNRPPTNFGINRVPQTIQTTRTVTVNNNNRYITPTRQLVNSRTIPGRFQTVTRVMTVQKNGLVNKK